MCRSDFCFQGIYSYIHRFNEIKKTNGFDKEYNLIRIVNCCSFLSIYSGRVEQLDKLYSSNLFADLWLQCM